MQIALTEAMQIISQANQGKWAVINSSLTEIAHFREISERWDYLASRWNGINHLIKCNWTLNYSSSYFRI